MTEIAWTEQASLPLLSIILWLPLAVLAGIAASRAERSESVIALAGACIELVLSLWLLTHFVRGTASLQFVEHLRGGGGWLSYHIGVDGLSILFLPLTSLLALLLVGYVLLQPPSARRRASLLLICAYQTILIGLFISLDALLFWLFAVAELVAAVLLVAVLGTGRNRIRTAVNLLQLLGVSVILLLVALLMLAWQHAGSQGGAGTFDMARWLGNPAAQSHQGFLLGVLLLALAIRLPAFPFHVWLPAVARQGPVAIAVVLLGGMQVAVYALLRIAFPLLPVAMHNYAWILTWVALAGILYGAVLAFMQLNLRSMLAFAVVSQNGAMLVALFSLTRAGFEGGLLLALNYGLALAGLLLIVGLIYRRTGTALLPRLAGLFEHAPLIGLAFLAAALGRIAMPGTPGFEAAHLALEGTLEARGWAVTMLAGLSNVLAAGYLFWAYQRIFLARKARTAPQLVDLTSGERVMAGLLCGVMFGVGLYASPWLEVVSASTQDLAAHVADYAIHSEAVVASDIAVQIVSPEDGI
jgi:NADH-quinone oxidoreductase subunit M